MPLGKFTDEWMMGNVEEGLKKADLVLDETFMTQSTGHQPLETRTAMAYWQNGKLYLHGSTQSTVQTVASVARWTGIPPAQVVIISEYTGGGFGSKIPGAISMAIPALLSKKANAPVMMRITREDEHFIGRARPGILARVKMGFRKDGRITAIDMYTICDNGPYDAQGDARSAGNSVSLAYQPETMRWRGMTVVTNTPPKTSQRAPGGMQGIGIVEPIIAKAAKTARPRSGASAQDQRAGRQGAVWRAGAERPPALRDERVRQGSARQGQRSVQVGGAQSRPRRRPEEGQQGPRHRRRGQPVRRRLDRLRRLVHHQARHGRIQFQSGIGNLGHAFDVRRPSPGRRNARRAVGGMRRRLRQHRRRTCRGPASRPAVRPRTR